MLQSVYHNDVDGDSRPDMFVYQVGKEKEDYRGTLAITSATGETLWVHRWVMTTHDLVEDLLEAESAVTSAGDKVSIGKWVKLFFEDSLNYGARIELAKLGASDLDDGQIDFAAQQLGLQPAQVKQEILLQEMSVTFSYRAEWREDLLQLVYLPTTRKFIAYSRGY